MIKKPTIIDLEASGFGRYSYPIEIGIVRSDGKRFCRLIKPFDDWTFWEPSAQSLHGISRNDLLNFGVEPKQVCQEMNTFLGNSTAYSDGWVVDEPWLLQLFQRSHVSMRFHLSPIEMILTEEQMNRWDDAKQRVLDELNLERHRASNDALIIQQTYKALSQKMNVPQ